VFRYFNCWELHALSSKACSNQQGEWTCKGTSPAPDIIVGTWVQDPDLAGWNTDFTTGPLVQDSFYEPYCGSQLGSCTWAVTLTTLQCRDHASPGGVAQNCEPIGG
jgi:hypothetical protein